VSGTRSSAGAAYPVWDPVSRHADCSTWSALVATQSHLLPPSNNGIAVLRSLVCGLHHLRARTSAAPRLAALLPHAILAPSSAPSEAGAVLQAPAQRALLCIKAPLPHLGASLLSGPAVAHEFAPEGALQHRPSCPAILHQCIWGLCFTRDVWARHVTTPLEFLTDCVCAQRRSGRQRSCKQLVPAHSSPHVACRPSLVTWPRQQWLCCTRYWSGACLPGLLLSAARYASLQSVLLTLPADTTS
jgi:hypothetical protein